MTDRSQIGADFTPSGASITTTENTCAVSVVPLNIDECQQPALQPQLMHTRQGHRVFKYWMLETLSVVLAVGLVAAIISTLAHFNGQTVPDWPFRINLNALIALLVTLCRGLILSTLAEIIGQAKWSWFSRQPRRMNALQRFDSASRGLLGSIKLLLTAPGSIFSLTSSIVIIVSLAMGPFAQQAIQTIDCVQNVSSAHASVPIAHYAAPSDTYYWVGLLPTQYISVTVDMQGALVNGLLNPGGNDSTVSPICQTGNCTFQSDSTNITYSSIGLCRLSVDTTSLVSRVRNEDVYGIPQSFQYNYTLPNGLNIQAIVTGIDRTVERSKIMDVGPVVAENLTWASSAFSDDFRNLAPLSIHNFTVLEFTKATCKSSTDCPHNVMEGEPQGGAWDYISVTSILYPCMRNYYAKVEKGTFQETIISTVPAEVSDFSPEKSNYTALKTPCVIDDKEYSVQNNFSDVPRSPGRNFTHVAMDGVDYIAPEECLYKMEYTYGSSINNFLYAFMLVGSCYLRWDMRTTKPSCPESWWLEPFYHGGNATLGTVSITVENIARAATNKLRVIGSSNYDPNQHESALGTVLQTTVCTVFDWQWLLLPIILVAVTAGLLALMVLQNSRDSEQPVWKSSLLPFMFYGMRESSSSEDDVRPALDLDELDKQAANVSCRWYSGGDAGFSRDESLSKKPLKQDIDMDSLLGTE